MGPSSRVHTCSLNKWSFRNTIQKGKNKNPDRIWTCTPSEGRGWVWSQNKEAFIPAKSVQSIGYKLSRVQIPKDRTLAMTCLLICFPDVGQCSQRTGNNVGKGNCVHSTAHKKHKHSVQYIAGGSTSHCHNFVGDQHLGGGALDIFTKDRILFCYVRG